MYYRQLRLIVVGPSWTMDNPLRTSEHDPEVRLRESLDAYDRIGVHAAAIGIIVAAIFGLVMTLASGAPAPAMLLAVLLGFGSGAAWHHVAHGRRRDLQRQADDLTATLGPTSISRSDIAAPIVAAATDRAVESATAIVESTAFDHGSLGDPDIVSADLADSLWEVLTLAGAVDRRVQLHGTANYAIDHFDAGDDVSSRLRGVADETVRADLAHLEGAIDALAALADRVEDIDAQLSVPAIEQSLIDAAAAAHTDADLSAIDRLHAQIVAASDLLDNGGSHPDSLDGRF